jgi:CubicO group peptidase (beta-lactamase class C family)
MTGKAFFAAIIFAALVLLISAEISAQTPTDPGNGLPPGNLSDAGISEDKLKKLEAAIAANEYERLTSVLIARNGKLVYEKYYGGFDENSPHDTRSATKTITGILIGIAVDKGFIESEKEPVLKYFADKKPLANPDPRKAQITIEDLLTMSSILECNDDNQFSRGHEERMYLIGDYFRFFLDLPVRGKAPWEDDVKDLPFKRRFGYCTAGTVLLGGILERATKTPVEDFAAKNLFAPLGIGDAKWQFTPMGTAMTGGGLRLKARDFIKIGGLFLNEGKFGEKRIISKNWVEKSVAPQVNAGGDTDYGYLWWLPQIEYKAKKYKLYAMLGNGGNKIVVIPELEAVVVLTNRLYGNRRGHEQTEQIVREYILPALADGPD